MRLINILCLTLTLLGIARFLSAESSATTFDKSQYPHLSFIGVLPVDLTEGLMSKIGFANPHGVMAQDVDEKGPAFQAGLRKGDIIRGVDGHGAPTASALNKTV